MSLLLSGAKAPIFKAQYGAAEAAPLQNVLCPAGCPISARSLRRSGIPRSSFPTSFDFAFALKVRSFSPRGASL
jgi:hypothetical protein